MSKHVSGINVAAVDLLCGYDWPGNVRELQNAIERAVLVCRTEMVSPADLPFQVNNVKDGPIGRSLSEMEKFHIKAVLEEAGWNIQKASSLLEIDRVTLYNKIKKYGFKREMACG